MAQYGAKIRELREGRKLSVKKVASSVSIPESRLSEIEKEVRIPTSGQIGRLEKFFQVNDGTISNLMK